MKPKLSIIVPIYNVQNYLEVCIDSILNQTFNEFEVILVNDGSNDKCSIMCDQYASTDNRIKVIHQENKGVSAARNVGIANSNGKYLLFIDPDDYVENQYCEELYKAIDANNRNLIICTFNKFYVTKNEIVRVDKVEWNTKSLSTYEKVQKREFFSVYENNLLNPLWNKIFDASVIKENNLEFIEEIQLGEDLLFILEYLTYIDGDLVILKTNLYNYMLSERESLIKKYHANLFEIIKYTFQKIYDCMVLFKSDINSNLGSYYNIYLNYISIALDNNFRKNSDLNIIDKFRYNNKILKSKEFSEALENANLVGFNQLYLRVLRTKNYMLLYCFKKIVVIKNKMIKKKDTQKNSSCNFSN